ncbi:MAG: tyrosine-protein phosphatase [Clostridia bacterium]|nr:tyrosine-protein phosphatase [Clostridia bacterium]
MKRFTIICLACLMLFSLIGCDGAKQNEQSSMEISTEVTEMTTEAETEKAEKKAIEAISPVNETVVLANDEVYEWWSTFHWGKTDSKPYYRHEDIYYPNAVTFSWTCELDGKAADYYRVYLSENADMSEFESYLVNESSLTLNHLHVGTVYYWQIDAVVGNNDRVERSEIFSFTTADSPRCVEIEGVSNTRDIGGMAAAEGYRIKQGMIYRGGKLENITDAGRDYFVNVLGVKTDLDLRTVGEGGAGAGSPLGENINYVLLDGRYYIGDKGISNETGMKIFADEIRVFTDPDNYPIYIHCSLGRDRTGTLAMVIEGLLGVDKNTIMMDYELSVFSVTGTLDNASVSAIRSNIRATYDYIRTFKGDSFAEKTENYLLSIGITAEEIQTIRDLLLEEVK